MARMLTRSKDEDDTNLQDALTMALRRTKWIDEFNTNTNHRRVIHINGFDHLMMRKHTTGIGNFEECLESLRQINPPEEIYCNGTWDTWLCWPPTKGGMKVKLPCPDRPGLIPTNFAHRTCGPMGKWEGRTKNDYSMENGYSNYMDCYTEEAKDIYYKYFANKSDAQKQLLYDIVSSTRTLEICGLALSMVTTFISLIIFMYFRSLKCNRTRIHKNLFVSILVQVLIELIQYVDQEIARSSLGENDDNSISNTPVFCEVVYALIEYTKTVKFMWMFIEGFYLHNLIVVSVFTGRPSYPLYYFLGWGVPMVLTIAWVIPMTQTQHDRCWYAYYNMPIIWIIEAPRVAVILVNMLFLLNIIRVLILKLRESHTNEANRVRKAVKAAIVLLPLLGITNFVVMIDPDTEDLVSFGAWAFISHFLISFEGFFISLIYCFLNGEVQSALKRFISHHMLHRTSTMDGPPTVQWQLRSKQVRAALRRFWQRCNQHRNIRGSSMRSRSFSVFTSFSEVTHGHNNNSQRSNANGSPTLATTTRFLLRPPTNRTPPCVPEEDGQEDCASLTADVNNDALNAQQVYSSVL